MMLYEDDLDQELELERERRDEASKAKLFNWLSSDNRGATYISYSQFSNLPASSFDFGADGFAGSCNSGGELLHLSAPSLKHGIIFARGAFSNSLYACLARAQMEIGGSSTFGLKIAKDQPPYGIPRGTKIGRSKKPQQDRQPYERRPSDYSPKGSSFRPGQPIERGCFNYRWPLNEYSLLLNDLPGDDDLEKETGTYATFSFVRDGVLYQVLRIEQGCRSEPNNTCYLFPPDGQIALTIGGTLYLQVLETVAASSDSASVLSDIDPSRRNLKSRLLSDNECLRIVDSDQEIALEARIFQLDANGNSYKPLSLRSSTHDAHGQGPPSATKRPLLRTESTTDTSVTLVSSDGSSAGAGSASCCLFDDVYTAIAKLHPSTAGMGGVGTRIETFVAAIRLVEGTDATGDTEREWPPKPTSESMHREVGVDTANPDSIMMSNPNATGAMWETILLGRDLRTDLTSEFTEISLIARCLEKILQVDVVPAPFETDDRPLALVSNAFIHPAVSLRALFWKVRFLVKVYRFLSSLERRSSRSEPAGTSNKGEDGPNVPDEQPAPVQIPDHPDFSDFDSYDRMQMFNIAQSQCTRIRDAIESIVLFLVELLPRSESDEIFSTPLIPFSERSSIDESDYYYIMITIWYVVKSLSRISGQDERWEFASRFDYFDEDHLKYSCIPPDNHNFGSANKQKIALLQWYHYGSMLSLAELGLLPPCWKTAAMKRKVYGMSNAARISSTARLFSKSTYSVEDEIVDRLAFLACELGLEQFDATADTVASASIQRVKQREFTKRLNPGPLPSRSWGQNPKETCGPWEIHSLCHNSRLNVITLENDTYDPDETEDWRATERREEEIGIYKSKIYHFLNAEATLVSCWERSHLKMRSGWLRSEATAVLGSTLLDIHNYIPIEPKLTPKMNPQMMTPTKPHPRSPRRPTPESYAAGIQAGLKVGLQTAQLRMIEEAVHMRHLMVHQIEILEKLKGEDTTPIDWTSFAPPRQYHPDDFINSLEDTPQLFRPPVTDHVLIPPALVKSVMPAGDDGFRKRDLEELVSEVPGSISVSDIVTFQKHVEPRAKASPLRQRGSSTSVYHYKDQDRDLVLDAVRAPHPNIKIVRGKEALVNALFDSLVDQSVQHRVLTARQLTKKLIQMLVYVMHPEVVTCLSNHVLLTPDFSCQRAPTWITSVTMTSWIAAPAASCKTDDVLIRLPGELGKFVEEADDARLGVTGAWPDYKMLVSSVVLSTNAFGDFSKCTIISETIDDAKLENFVSLSNEIWQIFIHQPQTARCLVFLHALGMQCAALFEQYERTIAKFASVVNFKDVFVLDEAEWTSDHSSIGQLRLSLWRLDSLYRIQYSLHTSLEGILEAKRELMDQIEEGAQNRSQALQRSCQEYLTPFEGNLLKLNKINEDLEGRIALAVRFKDALSAILTLRDSRIGLEQNKTSISQNSTIQKLTYLTIGYLPIGLMAALFSIPGEQNVVYQSMGQGWFIGAILLMSVATYAAAIWIGDIIAFLQVPEEESPVPGPKKSPKNLWTMLQTTWKAVDNSRNPDTKEDKLPR